jgi:hypothetical protein
VYDTPNSGVIGPRDPGQHPPLLPVPAVHGRVGMYRAHPRKLVAIQPADVPARPFDARAAPLSTRQVRRHLVHRLRVHRSSPASPDL